MSDKIVENKLSDLLCPFHGGKMELVTSYGNKNGRAYPYYFIETDCCNDKLTIGPFDTTAAAIQFVDQRT